MHFHQHRPGGVTQKSDLYLADLARDLKKTLAKSQQKFARPSLRMTRWELDEISAACVEFAEDLHNDIGIWKSLENYNREFFNTPLPLILRPGESMNNEFLNENRTRHLLLGLFQELRPGFILSPTHPDLLLLSKTIADFLANRFADIQKGSGIKKFLEQPNEYGWDVKRKLVWLGQHSYLFRQNFENYVEKNGGEANIPTIDDFICQENTVWSGLGVIDILAAILDITEKQRSDLRSWYERHFAYYRVLSIHGETIRVLNLINEKPYTVRNGQGKTPFKLQHFIIGSLVPWNGEWYWSGQQLDYKELTKQQIHEIVKDFKRKAAKITYRYCHDLAEKARDFVKKNYDDFVAFHGEDLVVSADGKSMAAAMQEQLRALYDSRPQEIVEEVRKKHNIPEGGPKVTYPPDIAENQNGVAIFFNPDEGQEIVPDYYHIDSGFKKKGKNLTDDERDAINLFIFSDAVSPRFVNRLIEKYGDESIAAAFFIRDVEDKTYVEYLLRSNKGHFYRKRYPFITIV
ncbi:MAG: DUF3843 family protein [bacterium]